MKRSLRNSSSRTAAARPRRAPWRLSSATLWRTWVVIGWAFSLMASAWGLGRLADHVRTPRPDRECRLDWGPSAKPGNWDTIEKEVSRAADLRPDDDPFDEDLCARVAQGLRASPWVADVERVVKRADGLVRVRATFREPFAYVDVKGRSYLIDQAGFHLPGECDTSMVPGKDWLNSPVITGVSKPPPPVGKVWEGADLAAGLSLAKFFKDEFQRAGLSFAGSLKAIDVANYDRREKPYDGELRIRTVNPRCYINWGAPPGQEVQPESSARRKVDMLRSLYGSGQGLFPDQPIDVRPEENVWINKPREAEQPRSRR